MLLLALDFKSTVPPSRPSLEMAFPDSGPEACQFSLQTVYHSIRFDRPINHNNEPPFLRDPFKGLTRKKHGVSGSGTGPR